MSKLSYESLHWGTKPRRTIEMQTLANCPARVVGELKACSYVADKGGKPAVFRHAFGTHKDGEKTRGPFLLEYSDGGEFQVGAGPQDLLAIGQAIDFELADGARIFCASCYLATDRDGRHVWICSPARVPYQVEARRDGPYVTPHGIEQ